VTAPTDIFRAGIFADRHAFIAGGTSGLNLGIARRFAALGAQVSLAGRDAEKAEAAARSIGDGRMALGISCDVRRFERVEAAFAQAAGQFGGIDIVVSGAAGNFVAPASAMSANGFRTVVDIDLNGTFNVFRACLPHLRKSPSLLAISAGQAVHPTPFQAHVCAAKAGINQLVRVLAQEWGPDGIRVNGLSPGPVAGTEGMARLAPTAAAQDAVKRRVPLGRYASIGEIADAAVYLCSDAAAYVTGTILEIDGGPLLSGSLRDPAHGLA